MERHTKTTSGERTIKDIKRKTNKQYSAEGNIRIVLDGLRGEDSIAELCRKEGTSQGVYYKWSKDFMGERPTAQRPVKGLERSKWLAGDIVLRANTAEVKDLRSKTDELEERVAAPPLENRLLLEDLECQIESCVEHYNHERYYESLNNVTPADTYFERV